MIKLKNIMRIYLDVCCLNRPFDDQTQDKVRLESEAILAILKRRRTENWLLLSSEVIDIEISKIPNADKREEVNILTTLLQSWIMVNEDIEKRAIALERLGFKPFDALHVACAEKGKADVFLTTDDHLLHKASQNIGILKVRVENPVKWLMEVIEK